MRLAPLLIALAALAACGPDAGSPSTDETGVGAAPLPLPAYFDCVRTTGAVVAAHRGGPAPGFPENAIETFANALEKGVHVLEIDVRQSSDGELILMHDERLGRTAVGEGLVSQLDAETLLRTRLIDPEGEKTEARIPRLADALAFAKGRAILELDIKKGTDLASVIETVRAAEATDEVVLIAYTLKDAREYAALAPEAMISVTIDAIEDLDVLAASGVDLAHVLAWTGTDEPNGDLARRLAARGIEVIFGTLGRDGLDKRFAEAGDDSGYEGLSALGIDIIATDRPFAAAAAMTSDDAVKDKCAFGTGEIQ